MKFRVDPQTYYKIRSGSKFNHVHYSFVVEYMQYSLSKNLLLSKTFFTGLLTRLAKEDCTQFLTLLPSPPLDTLKKLHRGPRRNLRRHYVGRETEKSDRKCLGPDLPSLYEGWFSDSTRVILYIDPRGRSARYGDVRGGPPILH